MPSTTVSEVIVESYVEVWMSNLHSYLLGQSTSPIKTSRREFAGLIYVSRSSLRTSHPAPSKVINADKMEMRQARSKGFGCHFNTQPVAKVRDLAGSSRPLGHDTLPLLSKQMGGGNCSFNALNSPWILRGPPFFNHFWHKNGD